MATKVQAATQIQSRPQAVNETLQEYIQQFTDFVIHAIGEDPTLDSCQVIIILLIIYVFNKEIKKQVTGMKNDQTINIQ